jgi:hypothetical protein
MLIRRPSRRRASHVLNVLTLDSQRAALDLLQAQLDDTPED